MYGSRRNCCRAIQAVKFVEIGIS